jgi:predicted HTH domain antitoxin
MSHSRLEILQEVVVCAYVAGEVSLGKAAELLGVSQEAMKNILRESDAEIHLGPCTVDELWQDVDNA